MQLIAGTTKHVAVVLLHANGISDIKDLVLPTITETKLTP